MGHSAERDAPTAEQVRTALNVTLWLSEKGINDGALRDQISHVRDALWDLLDEVPHLPVRHDRGCAAGIVPSARCQCVTSPAEPGADRGSES